MPNNSIPTLTTHLVTQYKAYREQLERTDPGEVLSKHLPDPADLAGFADWCEDYLDANRPVEQFYTDGIGFRLPDNTRVTLAREVAGGGQMQDSGSIAITPGEGLAPAP